MLVQVTAPVFPSYLSTSGWTVRVEIELLLGVTSPDSVVSPIGLPSTSGWHKNLLEVQETTGANNMIVACQGACVSLPIPPEHNHPFGVGHVMQGVNQEFFS